MSTKKRKPRINKRVPKARKEISVKIEDINYKNVHILKKFLSQRYKILPKKITGLSSKKQRLLKTEVKKARIMGLLPFTDRHALG